MADEKLKKEADAVVSSAISQEGARNALALLFPKLEEVLKTYLPQDREPHERKRRRRISEKEYAWEYFGLTPEPNTLSIIEIEKFLNSANPNQTVNQAVERINLAPENLKPKLRRQLLDALDGAFNEERPFSAEWLIAVLNVSPIFIQGEDAVAVNLYEQSNTDRLRWLLLSAFKSVSEALRAEMFKQAVFTATDMSVLTDLFRSQSGDINTKVAQQKDEPRLFGAFTPDLRSALLAKIVEIVHAGKLWDQAIPSRLIWFWWGCNLEDDVRAFLSDCMNIPALWGQLFRLPISRVRSSEGDYDQVSRRAWGMLLDLNALAEIARNVLENEQANAALAGDAKRFLDALEKGKSDPFG